LIYQTDSIVDTATATTMAVEEDIIDVIEVDTGNYSLFLELMVVLMPHRRKGTRDCAKKKVLWRR
jgi:hypothetical protein